MRSKVLRFAWNGVWLNVLLALPLIVFFMMRTLQTIRIDVACKDSGVVAIGTAKGASAADGIRCVKKTTVPRCEKGLAVRFVANSDVSLLRPALSVDGSKEFSIKGVDLVRSWIFSYHLSPADILRNFEIVGGGGAVR